MQPLGIATNIAKLFHHIASPKYAIIRSGSVRVRKYILSIL